MFGFVTRIYIYAVYLLKSLNAISSPFAIKSRIIPSHIQSQIQSDVYSSLNY